MGTAERTLEEAASSLSEDAIAEATRDQLILMSHHHLAMRRAITALVCEIKSPKDVSPG